jgi:ABC-type dipeptide/oligopeptide/nickel transport systems, permease components
VQLETIGAPFIQDRVDLQTAIDHLDFLNILSAPSAIHPFGTDDLGRDLLARALYGGRVSLLVGLTAMAIAISLGTIIGATAGFLGGVVDQILMRITDLFLSLPVIPLTLLVVYLFRDPVIQGYRARIRNHGHSCFLCEIVIRSQFHTTYEPEA